MSSVAEIVDAVRQLSPAEQRELVLRLEPVLLGEPEGACPPPGDFQSPEFTARLVDHFHKAKRAALAQAAPR